MKKIKTWEDVCKKLKIDPKQLPDVTGLPEGIASHLVSTYKLIRVAEALNGSWKPDWNNDDQYKYYPYWNMEGEFSLYYVCFYGCSFVPSRLCFKSREIANYAAETFLDLYKNILN